MVFSPEFAFVTSTGEFNFVESDGIVNFTIVFENPDEGNITMDIDVTISLNEIDSTAQLGESWYKLTKLTYIYTLKCNSHMTIAP